MKNLYFIFLCFLISSCSAQRHFVSQQTQYNYERGREIKSDSDFFFLGIGQTHRIDAVAVCGNEYNINAVESKASVVNNLITFFTLGIYSPREYTIYCKR